jgi:sugar O-acyltransferase (sialic acid O-acetyltransferase NeuD family)
MFSKPVIIVGSGGHAKVVFDALHLSGFKVLGFVTPDMDAGLDFCDKKILGADSVIRQYSQNEVNLANGIGSVPGENNRWNVANKMREWGYSFVTVIHPSAVVARDVILKEGVQLMAGVIIQSKTVIGRDSIINTGAVIDHDCKIEENCHLAPRTVCSGGVIMGKNVYFGTGSVAIERVSIGRNSLIAAGSVVYKNIPHNTRFIQKK